LLDGRDRRCISKRMASHWQLSGGLLQPLTIDKSARPRFCCDVGEVSMKNPGPPVRTLLPLRPYGRSERFCRVLLIPLSTLILTVGSISMAASQPSSNSSGDTPTGERPVM